MQLRKKYDPHEAEPRLARQWNDAGLYAFNPHSSAECFSVDTPPPYVSADHLHAGHVMSYSQAEFIVRYKRMRGLNVFYPMGFDDNGLPTERFVEAKHHVDKATIDRKEFVRMCLAETAEGAATYRRLWERLGISVDWSLCYSTMDERSRRTAQASFLDLQTRGLIERREEPIQWCFACGTSLAQADVESVEQAGRLHDIAFGGGLVISTTRPELLPACVALYAHPDDARYSPLLGTDATVPIFGHRVPIRAHPDADPMEIITKYSADAMRYWAAGSSLGHDLRYSESRIADGQRLCTKLWNAGRLIGDHLADEARPSVPDPACMSVADRWILHRFGIAVTDASRAFEEFDYSHALEAAEQFLQADLCDNYLEIVKPRLWEGSTASPQTMECTRAILVQTFRGTLKLLAPFLPFVTEELHGLLFAALSDAKSIHVSQWPQAPELAWDARDEEQSRVLLSLLGAVRKWKSNARLNAGAPLSSVRIACSHERRDTCCAIADDLRSGVRATDVGFAESGSVETGIEGITLEVTAR